MKRFFIAIDVPEKARRAAAAHIDVLRRAFPRSRVGWERPEKLHITLKFLGDLNDEQVVGLRQTVGKVVRQSEKFTVTIAGTGSFPPGGHPRILWLGAEDDGTLEIIAARLEDELAESGFSREKRPFSPHITIARVREPRSSGELASLHTQTPIESVAFEVHEIVVYESKPQPSGSVYSTIANYPLR